MSPRNRSRSKMTSPSSRSGLFYCITRNRHVGGGGDCCLRTWLGRLSHVGFHNIDTAFKIGAIFDADARGLDVADEFGVLADVDLVQRLDIAVNGSEHDDFARLDAGADTAVRPN